MDYKKIFAEHGWIEPKDSDPKAENAIGTCPFCEKVKLYLNTSSGLWDCKVCLKNGNLNGFYTQIAEHRIEALAGEPGEFLSEIRGLTQETFDRFRVGFNTKNGDYTLPYYSLTSPKVATGIKRYVATGNRLLNGTGMKVPLYGTWLLPKDPKTFWLCEGEWDAMALYELFDLLGLSDSNAVLGVPGAGGWKAEWNPILLDKEVVVLYDNDRAGAEGWAKVWEALHTITKSLKFLMWPEGTADKYDVRDLYREMGTDAITFIEKHLRTKEQSEGKKKTLAKKRGTKTDPEEVYQAYRKWLHLPNTDVLDVLFGSVLANRLQGDPVWIFLVAPSGGTKSELLMSFSGSEEIYSTTTLTGSALISGMRANPDPSLIPNLDKKVLIVKDFTTILTSPETARDEVFGILRDAYDGKIEKNFGNGVVRRYTSKFGVIAGTTPAIEMYTEQYVALGERFLRWRELPPVDSTSLVLRALQNSNKETSMRDDLLAIGSKVLGYDYHTSVHLGDEEAMRLVALAQWVAMMRGVVVRDKYTHDITHAPFKEVGTRLAKQFTKLGMGISMFRGEETLTHTTLDVVSRCGWYTTDSKLSGTVLLLFHNEGKGGASPLQISEWIGLPPATISKAMESLFALGAVDIVGERKESMMKERQQYRLSKENKRLMKVSGLTKLLEEGVIK